MNKRQEDLKIARKAYMQIKDVMQSFQKCYDINFCWDECIWVNDSFFQYSDLRNEDRDEED